MNMAMNMATNMGSNIPPVSAGPTDPLDPLARLDGFVAAALVDSTSGMMLESRVDGVFAIEMAAAANTEVVQAKLRAMKEIGLGNDYIEDILITLGTQYHLIRLLSKHPEIFIYVALERSNANLAKARLVMRSVDINIDAI